MTVLGMARQVCPACAASCVWNAATRRLVCEACGSDAVAQPDASPHRVALDLGPALDGLADDGALEPRSVQCHACQGVMMFAAHVGGRPCEFCGAPVLLGPDDVHASRRPHLVLPCIVDAGRVRDEIREWIDSEPLVPRGAGRRVRIERVEHRYVPYWTFDTKVNCLWHAQAGYYEDRRVTVRNAEGKLESDTVTTTRWVPAVGEAKETFTEEPVPGTTRLPAARLNGLLPFPTAEAAAYDPGFLAGFEVERCGVTLRAASTQWYADMWTRLTALCKERVPGDTHRDFQIEPYYKDQAFRLVLVPVLVLAYRYGGRSYEVAINGRTGKMHGDTPLSGWKMTFMLLAAAVIVGLVSWGILWFIRMLKG